MTMPDPIGVSGPGALSQRTDKQPMSAPTGMPYGDRGQLLDMQRAAPMAASGPPTPPPTEIHAPSQRPTEPVTAGAASGPGPGPEALTPGQAANFGAPFSAGPISQAIARAASIDTSGTLAALLSVAQQKGL